MSRKRKQQQKPPQAAPAATPQQQGQRRLALWRAASAATLLLLLSATWLLMTVNGATSELANYDIIAAGGGIALALAAQTLALFVVFALPARFAAVAPARALLPPLFVAANFFTLHLVFISALAKLPTYGLAALFAVAVLIAYALLDSMQNNALWRRGVLAAAALLAAQQTAVFVIAAPPSVDETGKSANVVVPDFTQKPNVYFFSFDAMWPLALAQKYTVAAALPYQDYLQEAGFRRFTNAFSSAPSTIPSLNKNLAFDADYYHALPEGENGKTGLFTGQTPAPLAQIFQANGYQVNTYFRDSYIGGTAGPHIDNFYFNSASSLCGNHLPRPALSFGFFGYCKWKDSPPVLAWAQKFLPNLPKQTHGGHGNNNYINFLLQDIAARRQSGKPQLFVAHFITTAPDHAPLHYDHRVAAHRINFRKQYAARAEALTRPSMQRLTEFVRKTDPSAFIWFYSDHGPWTSRQFGSKRKNRWVGDLTEEEFAALSPKDREFVIHDRYGILSAFSPADACAPYFDEALASDKPATNLKIIRQIVRCLAGGKDPLPNAPLATPLLAEKWGYKGRAPPAITPIICMNKRGRARLW